MFSEGKKTLRPVCFKKFKAESTKSCCKCKLLKMSNFGEK